MKFTNNTSFALHLLFKHYEPKNKFMLYVGTNRIGFNYFNHASLIGNQVHKYIII